MVLRDSQDAQSIEVTDRTLFKDAPPQFLRKLAVNRLSIPVFLRIICLTSSWW